MVPVLTKGGRSFKGAAAYYLHDKRGEGEAERFTNDRVAWVETLNLDTADPYRAWRRMAATAMSQAELKAAAGVKATGRKLTAPVFAYSLSWHEKDNPTRAQMLAAAHESVSALGLAGYQAMIIAHNDTKHPHVHILVNRVHPETGIAAKLDGSKNRIQAWALDYQQRHGQTHCPQRVENAKKRQQGQHANQKRVTRNVFEFRRAVANDSLKTRFVVAEQRQKDAQLYSYGRAMGASHAKQAEDLTRTYRQGKTDLFDHQKRRMDTTRAAMKAGFRSTWADLFKRQREERRRFEATENGVLGMLSNTAMVMRELRKQEAEVGLLALVYAVFSRPERMNVLETAHRREREGLARELGAIVGKQMDVIRGETDADLAKLRTAYGQQWARLETAQAKDRAELRGKWQLRDAERKTALAHHQAAKQGQQARRAQPRLRIVRDDTPPRQPPKPWKPWEPG